MRAKNMSKQYVTLATLGVCVALTACGGNGGGGGDVAQGDGASASVAARNASVEGAWHSQQTNGDVLDILVLENGTIYAMSVAPNVTAPLLAFDQGSYTLSGDKLAAQLTHYNDLGTTLTGTVNAAVVAGTSITGTASTNGSTTQNAFSVKPLAAADSSYDYNMAASLSRISGSWSSGNLLNLSSPVTFSIDPSGVLAGTNLGCSFTGKFQPRPSGKNVFDVSIAFGQSPCTAPGKTAAGVAISYLGANGKRQLTAALQDSTKTYGTMVYAQR